MRGKEVEFDGILPYIPSPGYQCCFDSSGWWCSALKARLWEVQALWLRCWSASNLSSPEPLCRAQEGGLGSPKLAHTRSSRDMSKEFLYVIQMVTTAPNSDTNADVSWWLAAEWGSGAGLPYLFHSMFSSVLCTANPCMQGPALIYSWKGRLGKWGCSRKMGEQCGLGLEEYEHAVGGWRKDWRQRRRRALTGPWHKFLGGGARQIYSE